MAQPPERKFADIARQIRTTEKKTQKKKPRAPKTPGSSNIGKVFTTILLLIVAGGSGYYLLANLPTSSSLGGEYSAPSGFTAIEEHSKARWHIHDTHANILSTCVAWYLKSSDLESGSISTVALEDAGFFPFLMNDPTGLPIEILTEIPDGDTETADFVLGLGEFSRDSISIFSRKTFVKTTPLGKSIISHQDDIISVESDDFTSFISQFQPDEPTTTELYSGFFAQIWEKALIGFVRTYNRPPQDLADLMDGVGLELNPDNVWPYEEDHEFDAGSEGGIVDGEIVYWKVTNEDESSGGQARYYDQYTAYDDPDTPDVIVAGGRSSAVASPSDLDRTFNVMFSLRIYHDMLIELLTPAEPEDGG